MTLFIHRDSKFNKRLDALRKAGGNASLAAKNADQLIDNLVQGQNNPDEIGRQTKHGEARVKNCVKYNLGNGYRMICVRQGRHLGLLYIGTHDDCDRWLNYNRGVQPIMNEDNAIFSLSKEYMPENPLPSEKADPETDEYEELLFQKIDEKILKNIFRGLCVN